MTWAFLVKTRVDVAGGKAKHVEGNTWIWKLANGFDLNDPRMAVKKIDSSVASETDDDDLVDHATRLPESRTSWTARRGKIIYSFAY